jgi:hypothetical protein
MILESPSMLELVKKHMTDTSITKTLADMLVFLGKFLNRLGSRAARYAPKIIPECFTMTRAPIANAVKLASFAPLTAIFEETYIPETELSVTPAKIVER